MKYRFEIFYANKYLQQVSDYMSKLDLGMDGMAIKEIMTFESKKDLNIKQIKELIIQGYEQCECKVINIEGGKVE